LHESYYQKSSTTRIFEVLEELQNKNKYNFKIKDLDKLKNWNVNENVIYDNDQVEFIVQGVRVSVADREVSFWEQPIVHNIGLEKIVLYCQKKDGILKFLLNAQIIIGMNEALVWGPSDQNTRYDEKINFGGQTILAECMQSDEGGRFYHSKCLYQIIDVSEKVKVPESDMSYWASLFEIQNLTMQSKKTTNELRSVLSLLLKFL
jgi:oxidase EvaA